MKKYEPIVVPVTSDTFTYIDWSFIRGAWGHWAVRETPDMLYETNREEYERQKQEMIDASKLSPKKEPWKC